jgi:hypothetical protein
VWPEMKSAWARQQGDQMFLWKNAKKWPNTFLVIYSMYVNYLNTGKNSPKKCVLLQYYLNNWPMLVIASWAKIRSVWSHCSTAANEMENSGRPDWAIFR